MDQGRTMPGFYLHLCKGPQRITEDTIGQECSDNEAACSVARKGGGLLTPVPPSALPYHRLSVFNEAGDEIFTLPLLQVVLA